MESTRKLGMFLRPYWKWAILAPLLMALEVAMDLLQPHLIQQIIDQGVAQSNLDVVIRTGLLQVGVALIGLVGGVGCGVFAIMAGQHFGADLRAALFRKVQSLSFGNLDRLETGALITRLTNDVTQIQEMVMMLLRIMVRVPLLLVGSLIMAIITSPELAWIFLVLIPIVLVALVWIIQTTFPMFGEVQRRLDALNTVMQENLAGVRVVKAFARAIHEIQRFHTTNNRLMDQNLRTVRISTVTMPFMMITLNAGIVAALWFGGVRVTTGGLQVGQLVAFINYLTQTLMSLMMISMLVMRFARAEASAERIHEVLDTQPDVPIPTPAATLPHAQGRIVFEDVSFGYRAEPQNRGTAEPRTKNQEPRTNPSMPEGRNHQIEQKNNGTKEQNQKPVSTSSETLHTTHYALPSTQTHPDPQSPISNLQSPISNTADLVLKDISFTAEPGQTVALLGATGAGKSSLVNLIPRFYDVTAGRITIDGVDIRSLDEAKLRGAIGVALQESILFTGTIRDNIRYGRPEASDDEVTAAAKMAQAHEFISRFPDAYDSIVGQRGVNLSGGQKQRIAIARVLLTNPAVLILDDSTSAVDVETEARIQAALVQLPHRQTRIVVAQRISTVLHADIILILDDGQVVAQGNHQQLLENSPIYREIYESQMDSGAIAHD